MNWLSLMSEKDKKEIVATMADLLFNHVTDITPGKGLGSALGTVAEAAVDRSLARHGFRPAGSDTATVHSVMAAQTARDRAQAQMLALSALIGTCKQVSAKLNEFNTAGSHGLRNSLDIAVAGVEREFKP